MSAFGRVKLARQRAEALIAELGVAGPPVDPIAIARDRDIVVQPKPPEAEQGVSGMLLRHGDTFGILYAEDARGTGFQRFSIAHELGHYFLERHCDHLLGSGWHASRAGQGSTDPYEREADAFASALLMTLAFLNPVMRSGTVGLDLLLEVAATFETSLTASGLRIAETCREPLAFIVSHKGRIEICAMTEAFKPHARRGWLRRGDLVSVGSSTAELAADPGLVRTSARTERAIDIADWYDCERATAGSGNLIRIVLT